MKYPLTEEKKILAQFFSSQPDVSAVYLFGSQADGTAHPKSDLDIAVLFKKGLGENFYADQQLYLGGKLCEILGRNDVDVVILNRTSSSELKYNIVHDGEVLFNQDKNLAEYELRTEHEYHDHIAALRRAGFTNLKTE